MDSSQHWERNILVLLGYCDITQAALRQKQTKVDIHGVEKRVSIAPQEEIMKKQNVSLC